MRPNWKGLRHAHSLLNGSRSPELSEIEKEVVHASSLILESEEVTFFYMSGELLIGLSGCSEPYSGPSYCVED